MPGPPSWLHRRGRTRVDAGCHRRSRGGKTIGEEQSPICSTLNATGAVLNRLMAEFYGRQTGAGKAKAGRCT